MPGLEEALVVGDLDTVDRGMRRAFERIAKWQRSLRDRASDGEAGTSVVDPLAEALPLAGKKAFSRFTELHANDPARLVSSQRHVLALCFVRICGEGTELLAEALHAPQPLAIPNAEPSSFAASLAALVHEHDARNRHAHLDVLVRAARPIAQECGELAKLEREVAKKLGLEHPAAIAAELPRDGLTSAARALLSRTDALAVDVRRRVQKRLDRTGDPSFLDGIALARADTATEGWPARVTEGWLLEALPAMKELSPTLGEAPQIAGASSFARALAAAGHRMRIRRAPRGLPFVVAHDPWPVAAYRAGVLFGSLALSPEFHRRALGLGQARAHQQAAQMAESALLWARFAALRALVALEDVAPGEIEDLSRRVFGSPFDPKLEGAFPVRRLEDAAKFRALLEGAALSEEMVHRFDFDWFRNPRSARDLAGRFAGPMRDPEPPADLSPLVASGARKIEEQIG